MRVWGSPRTRAKYEAGMVTQSIGNRDSRKLKECSFIAGRQKDPVGFGF